MAIIADVYRLYIPFIVPPKEKLVVPAFVTADGRLRLFVINSERTDFQKNRPDVCAHVLPLEQGLHSGFLKHNSWLACHEVIGGWTAAQFDAKIAANPKAHVGTLSPSVILAVRQIVASSRILSSLEKVAVLSQWP